MDKRQRQYVPRTAGVAAVDRMQMWGWDLAARLDARTAGLPVSPARAAADACKSSGKAHSTAVTLAKAGDPDCSVWMRRAQELRPLRQAAYSETKLAATFQAAMHEAIAAKAEPPRGFRFPEPYPSPEPEPKPKPEPEPEPVGTIYTVERQDDGAVTVERTWSPEAVTVAEELEPANLATTDAKPRRQRETPEERAARIAAWREQSAADRESRRLACKADREARIAAWRAEHRRAG